MISIVDDDASVRDGVNGLVRSLGYTTAVFSSAEEYLQSGAARDSSCLITDLGNARHERRRPARTANR